MPQGDIQVPRFGRYIQRLFGLRQALTLGQALPDVMASLDLEQPRAENDLFLGNDLCSGFGELTAAAAEFAQVSIGFAATPTQARPGSMIVLEKIYIRVANSARVNLSFGSVAAHAAVGAGQSVKTDTRRFAQAPVAKVGTLSNAVLPTGFLRVACIANTQVVVETPGIVLVPVPGFFEQAGLIVSHETANQLLTVGFQWRERPVLPDELTP